MRWLALLLAAPAAAEEVAASGGSFGGAGLVEMRNARLREDGNLEAGGALRRQRDFWFLDFQALPFLETTFRIANRLNGTTGQGITIDRSFDAKLRLAREGRWWPALALGMQDAVGTGIYGGEYLVASKRFGSIDATLGLGWGRLATSNDLPGLGQRSRSVGQGGLPSFRSWFRGGIGVFGGVEWNLPPLFGIEGLRVKAERSSDTLRDERGGWPARTTHLRGRAASHWNGGLQWQDETLDLGLFFVHGTDALVRVSLRMDAHAPPSLPPVPLPALPPRPAAAPASLEQAGFTALRAAGFRPVALVVEGAAARVVVAGGPFRRLAQVAGRAARALQPVLPAQVETLRVEWQGAGVTMARLELLRGALEGGARGQGSAEEVLAGARLLPAEAPRLKAPGPWLDWGVAPRVPIQLGDPRTGARWQLALAAGARLELGAGFALAASLGQAVAGNLGGGLASNSVLPHVRSDLGLYARKGSTAVTTLYAERIWSPAEDVFARLTAGLLEPMFAGVSGEALWRPAGSPVALGLDLAWLRQRDYGQKLDLRRYRVVTGHASLYADLPWFGLYGILRAGRYLAGDWGGTVELGRRFESGIEVGGFATFTTVPFKRFGEGSFDKGIYLRIPLEVFGRETAAVLGSTLRPVLRDGGQRLSIDNPLWELTRDGRAEALGRGFLGFLR